MRKKWNKLQSYLQQGKVICGSSESKDENDRSITTLACIRMLKDKTYEVEVEVFYSTVDISELNLQDVRKVFVNLEDAYSYLETEFGIMVNQMHGI